MAKDPAAARKYYETAANLGDTDAMNEAARCFEEGFGGKKDKVGPWIDCQACEFVLNLANFWSGRAVVNGSANREIGCLTL